MDDSFTRSLYIGRDKTLEVARRREAAQNEIKARREAKIREHNERLSRAAQQKESELKEKIRQRQEKELQKQKAVLDRRCAQLEQDKVKMAEILQKAHGSASRPAQINRKSVYAFGSSTPRAPTYLDAPRHYITHDLSTSAERLGSPSNSPGTSMSPPAAVPLAGRAAARTPSRIMGTGPTLSATPKARKSAVGGGASVPPAMTRSVFGRLTTAKAKPLMSGTTSSLSSRKATSSNNSAGSGDSLTSGTTNASSTAAAKRTTPSRTMRTTQSLMTQSLYEPKRATPVREVKTKPIQQSQPKASPAAAKAVSKPPAVRNPTPTGNAAKPPTGMQEKKPEVENRPPPIRPRKATQMVVEQKSANDDQQIVTAASPLLTKLEKNTSEQADVIKPNESGSTADLLESLTTNLAAISLQTSSPSSAEASLAEKKDEYKQPEQLQVIPPLAMDAKPAAAEVESEMLGSSKNSSTGNLLTVGREEWDSGHESNSAVDVDTTPTSLDKEESGDGYSLDTPKALSVDESDNNSQIVESDSKTNQHLTSPPSPTVPSVSAALEAAEKERESRRQKLNEILQRTRNAAGSGSAANNSTSLNSTDALSSPLRKTSGIDTSALAQDLLAQRRQKLQGLGTATTTASTAASIISSFISNGNGREVPNLDSDLNGVGYFGRENSDLDSTITPNLQKRLNSAIIGVSETTKIVDDAGGNEGHFRQNPLVEMMPGEAFSQADLLRQHKQKLQGEISSTLNSQHQSDPEDPLIYGAGNTTVGDESGDETRRENGHKNVSSTETNSLTTLENTLSASN